MSDLVFYHNPRCSKSREALALLQDRDQQPEIVHYLKTPPTEDELRALHQHLGGSVRDMMRSGEKVYKELNLAEADDDALFAAMAAHPVLIERPILVAEGRAVIGRPPERVLELV